MTFRPWVAAVADLIETSQSEGILEVRFNRPEALNALNVAMAEQFEQLCERLVAQSSIRVLILSGNGRAFMAGGDLKAFRETPLEERPHLSRRIIGPLHRGLQVLSQSDVITIAAVHGSVAGAGMSFALFTDLAVAAEDAHFNFAYAKIAASPDCGGSFSLTRLVGMRRAIEIALLSGTLDAKKALEWGLINRVVPADQLRPVSFELAHRLSTGPRRSLAAVKRLLYRATEHSLREQLEAELESFSALSGEADFAEGLDAFFSKRSARFGRNQTGGSD